MPDQFRRFSIKTALSDIVSPETGSQVALCGSTVCGSALCAGRKIFVICIVRRKPRERNGRKTKKRRGSSGSLWWLRKHPGQIQSRLQTDGSSVDVLGFFDRAVESEDCNFPIICFALLGCQSSDCPDSVPYRPQCRVLANQLERQRAGTNQ